MISIVVPVYNEASAIEKFHRNLVAGLASLTEKWEVVYVDDGSTDNSGELLGTLPHTRCLRHDTNLGYGAAVKTGIYSSPADLIGIIDCDDTYDPRDFSALMKKMADHDMAVGARKSRPNLRWASKRLLRAVASYAVAYPIPDLNSGLRIFRRSFVEKVAHLLPNGFSLTTTITLCAFYYGYRVAYLPVEYGKREGKSKIRPLYDFMNFTMMIFRIMILFNPLKFFLPPSIIMGMIGGVFLVRDILDYNVAQTSLLMLINGFILFAIGLLAEAIRWKK